LTMPQSALPSMCTVSLGAAGCIALSGVAPVPTAWPHRAGALGIADLSIAWPTDFLTHRPAWMTADALRASPLFAGVSLFCVSRKNKAVSGQRLGRGSWGFASTLSTPQL
jgi:hypothetical protein